MIKNNIIAALLISFFYFGCSSSIETVNFSADEKFQYAMQLYNDKDYLEAINEFQAILLQFPGNEVADDAQYYLGLSRFQRDEHLLAAYEFSRLIKNMPASSFVPDAQFMLAESYYILSPDFSLDQTYTRNSIKEFQAFIDFFPTDVRAVEADKKIREMYDKLAQKEYNAAYIYEKLQYYNAAILYYSYVLEIYHDSRFAPLASYNKVQLLIERNRNNEALTEVNRFLKSYPESTRYTEMERLKNSLEQKLSASK
jgi:outer membrane protein assembly factor BamD